MLTYSSYSDHELLQLLSADDNQAFAEIYNRYWQMLFVVAAHKSGNQEEARETVQELFMDIWYRRKELSITASLKSYLSVALNYKIIKILARRNRQLRYQQHAAHYLFVADQSTEDWLSFEELKERLEKLVSQLPEKCRLVFQLSREEGMTQKQIAETLNISTKTVESHLTKALRALKGGLKQLLFSFHF